MALVDLLERLYGVKTDMRVNPLTNQIALTITPLLLPNPNRLAWTIFNLTNHHCYLAFDPAPSATHGIYLPMSGGVVGLLFSEDFELVTYPLWGLADTGACDVYLVEVVAV